MPTTALSRPALLLRGSLGTCSAICIPAEAESTAAPPHHSSPPHHRPVHLSSTRCGKHFLKLSGQRPSERRNRADRTTLSAIWFTTLCHCSAGVYGSATAQCCLPSVGVRYTPAALALPLSVPRTAAAPVQQQNATTNEQCTLCLTYNTIYSAPPGGLLRSGYTMRTKCAISYVASEIVIFAFLRTPDSSKNAMKRQLFVYVGMAPD